MQQLLTQYIKREIHQSSLRFVPHTGTLLISLEATYASLSSRETRKFKINYSQTSNLQAFYDCLFLA